MNTQISSSAMTVESLYNLYAEGKLIVNRKYQRKLVWTYEEKAKFIDSIYNKYSVPLLLLSNSESTENEGYEIIDGMQRLNAICSFIESEFPLTINDEKKYFDLSIKTSTNIAMNDGFLSQKNPVLSKEVCTQIINYQIPVSIILNGAEQDIEEIFRRINSYGRQLSRQEIRQAGAVGLFSDLVRRLASKIRRDSSPKDILTLNKMKDISLSNRKLQYGININDVFWVKQGIITVQNMRVSRDEELIALILIYILLGDEVSPSASTLDKIYKYDLADLDGTSAKVEKQIEKYGIDNLQTWFIKVFDELINIIDKSGTTFRELLFEDEKGERLVRTFQVTYLALYSLLINKNMNVYDYNGLSKEFRGMGTDHFKGISSDRWDAKYRNRKIQSLEGVFSKYFLESDESRDDAIQSWVVQLENIFSHSKIEGTQYDFKIGFYTLDPKTQKFDSDNALKIVQTLTAMANKGKKEKGYVIIGVADKKKDAEQYTKIYEKDYRCYGDGDFYITGIADECQKHHAKRDDYLAKIKTEIRKSPVEKHIVDNLLSSIKFANYFEKEVMVFEIKSEDKPMAFDNKFYIRQGNSVEEVEGANAFMGLMNRFA